MEIWLVRHGETALNAARVLQPPDTPLSAHGLKQADALAERLVREPLAAVLSSDMLRAEQTAQAIVRKTGLTLRTTPLLHERNFGDWRGRPYDSLEVDPLQWDGAPPGGESPAVFAQRCQQAFEHMLAVQCEVGGPLLVVTHGLVIHRLLESLPRSSQPVTGVLRLGNTSITVFDAAAPHLVRLVNCVRHLAGDLQEDGRSLSGG